MNNKIILLTGGGTAGHVTPHLSLLPILKAEGYSIEYIGSKNSIESEIMHREGIHYKSIYCGKLRRYFSWENFKDIFRVLFGTIQAFFYIKKLKPNIVFSKGGFVAVPVVVAAKLNKIPIICHESDITPGLATQISSKFAQAIATTFPECSTKLGAKCYYTGTPLRKELFKGDKETALKEYGLNGKKPILLVMGGSQGALAINECLHESLDELLKDFDILHLCGEGKVNENLLDKEAYIQIPYLHKTLPNVLQAADIIVSRAGSNSISEFHALKKPMLLIPLPLSASRGDQILNAKSFEQRGIAKLLFQEDMNKESFIAAIKNLYEDRQTLISNMENDTAKDGTIEIIKLIDKYCKK
ncbi:MAG: undecaprenyldiphospho-muramoylpentapeptide beta-N-acetylglucosaminyltransferase [Christensenellaceae bacterium]|nr:undecaprenyldiphospho-muramoylpentapeptide beta-N-acetylglucosaminyltransferase [Christensenellaceae bacterium]